MSLGNGSSRDPSFPQGLFEGENGATVVVVTGCLVIAHRVVIVAIFTMTLFTMTLYYDTLYFIVVVYMLQIISNRTSVWHSYRGTACIVSGKRTWVVDSCADDE